MPGASYMVSSMSSANVRRSSVIWVTGFADGLEPRVGMNKDRANCHGRDLGHGLRLGNTRPQHLSRPRAAPFGRDALNFDEPIDRCGTHSMKWDEMQARYGVSPRDGIPMWVADMDFRPPQSVQDAVGRIHRSRHLRLFRRQPRLYRRHHLVDAGASRLESGPRGDLQHPWPGQRHLDVPGRLHRCPATGWCCSPRSITPSPASSAPPGARWSNARWSTSPAAMNSTLRPMTR